jgi:hypothetical protein
VQHRRGFKPTEQRVRDLDVKTFVAREVDADGSEIDTPGGESLDDRPQPAERDGRILLVIEVQREQGSQVSKSMVVC